MAPEDILSSVDPSRREFLKKVIAGSAFAVPVMASFSVEGPAVQSASASSNQPSCSYAPPGSPCCVLAVNIAIRIASLSVDTGAGLTSFGALPEVIAALLEPLGDAQGDMAEGVRKGKGECVNGPARAQFREAARALAKYRKSLDDLCGSDSPLSQNLLGTAQDLIDDIADLVAGIC